MASKTPPGGIVLTAPGPVNLVFDAQQGPPSEAIIAISGNFVGAQIQFNGSIDNGMTYNIPLFGYRTDTTGVPADSGTILPASLTPRAWRCQVEGLNAIQLLLVAPLVSGQMTVNMVAGAFFGTPPAQGGNSALLSAILFEAIKTRQLLVEGFHQSDYLPPQLDVTLGQ